ncbi:RusA family crossover junction endodeoxyribonuclease [Flavobacterium sp. KACC 22761]|uniref:RusA family crossover junction endodeoxyribonuclease n=1 Tax=Flavobacterium sp. KACC 22761 TaxID=3092665 RepID=UPI002A75DA8D|nr:RusA family crossover junction endodeoxyribonuclease [Flavobacterium sp. KACC 22761]WPO78206.1 RusA family crossover junction endodeoxyribonuclease [Flavobacterium sp. KACC 22761]
MTNFQHNLNEPPEFGELNFSFDFEPVSLQSNSAKKAYVRAEIRKVTKTLNYLLSGDVKVEIQWLVHEQERYESANAPDMDNIIKPILDGLSGPEGVLIDDCQVQTIGSHWIDWTKKEHKINISIKYIPDDYVSKINLIFVNLGNNLFIPLQSDLPTKAKKIIIEILEKGMDLRELILKETGDYYQAKMAMSVQRIFHKSRISDAFVIIEKEEFKKLT